MQAHRSFPRLARAVISSLAALLMLDAAAAGAATVPLEVMTFNIRYGAGLGSWSDPNGWLYTCGPRRDRVVNTIRADNPDILGVQEALVNQVTDLRGALPDYGFYGVGRNDGRNAGEFSGIFFRSARFTLAASGMFWLSDTPDKPGTVFPCSGSIRIASWVILDDAATGASYFVLNTHWDNVCQESRERSAALVRQKIADLAGALPVVVMGDLNANESSAALLELVGANDPGGLALTDAYRYVFPIPRPDEATFHGYTGATEGSRIDFVLPTTFFTPAGATIDRTQFSCGWPSDHYPVLTSLDVPVGPGAIGGESLERAAPRAPAVDPCIPDCVPGGCAAAGPRNGGPALPAAVAAAAALVLLAHARARRRRDGH